MSYQHDTAGGAMRAAAAVITDADREQRREALKSMDEIESKQRESAKRNRGFTQVYPRGWQLLNVLATKAPSAFRLYAFFAEHLDPSCGAVVCDQQFLADQFAVSVRTVQRWLDALEEHDAIIRIPVAGRVCAYALDPHTVWNGYDTSKNYAAFTTKTLVNKDGEIQRRIKTMIAKRDKQTLVRDPNTIDFINGKTDKED